MAVALIALAAVSVASQLYSGYQANQSARKEADATEAQGSLMREEAYRSAWQRAEEVEKSRSKQKLAFLTNGVQISGTPELVLDETTRQGQAEVDALVRRGNALYDLSYQKADIMRSEGRAALIGGMGKAASTGASMYAAGQSPTSGLGGIGTDYSQFGGGQGTAIMTSSGAGYRKGIGY